MDFKPTEVIIIASLTFQEWIRELERNCSFYYLMMKLLARSNCYKKLFIVGTAAHRMELNFHVVSMIQLKTQMKTYILCIYANKQFPFIIHKKFLMDWIIAS